MIYLIVILLGGPCVEVKSGVVVVREETGDREISIGGGTYCPSPADKQLALEMVEKNTMIKKLKLQLDVEHKRREREVEYWVQVDDRWAESHKACRMEVLALRGFWNRWGKTLLWSGVAALVAAGTTYLLVKAEIVPVK